MGSELRDCTALGMIKWHKGLSIVTNSVILRQWLRSTAVFPQKFHHSHNGWGPSTQEN